MPEIELWALTEHSCRHCLGRVLERDGEFRCANCGVAVSGVVEDLCWCGFEVKGRNAGWRCVRNPNPRPAVPDEIILATGA